MATKSLTILYTSSQVPLARISAVLQALDRLYYWMMLLKPESSEVNLSGIMDLLLSRPYVIPYGLREEQVLKIQSLCFGSSFTATLSAEDEKDRAEFLDDLHKAVDALLDEVSSSGNPQQAVDKIAQNQFQKINDLKISDNTKLTMRVEIRRRYLDLYNGLLEDTMAKIQWT